MTNTDNTTNNNDLQTFLDNGRQNVLSQVRKHHFQHRLCKFPRLNIIAEKWDEIPAESLIVLYENNSNRFSALPYDLIASVRNTWRLLSSKYGLFAGIHYRTVAKGRKVYLFKLAETKRGIPPLPQNLMEEAYKSLEAEQIINELMEFSAKKD